MIQKYFNRYEIKYQISLKERDKLISYFKGFMTLDPHVQNGFDYEVRSLYFDSLFKNSYFEKMNGENIRRKLRVRFYPDFVNGGNEIVFIEIKRKVNENVSKARIAIKFGDLFKVIDGNTSFAKKFFRNLPHYDRKTLEEIWYLYKRFNLKPVCVVSYKRQPFVGKIENRFRITFDTNMKVRNSNFNLHYGTGKYFIPRNFAIMEIKFNDVIPNWVLRIVQINNCVQEKVSKFANGLEKTNSFCLI